MYIYIRRGIRRSGADPVFRVRACESLSIAADLYRYAGEQRADKVLSRDQMMFIVTCLSQVGC